MTQAFVSIQIESTIQVESPIEQFSLAELSSTPATPWQFSATLAPGLLVELLVCLDQLGFHTGSLPGNQ